MELKEQEYERRQRIFEVASRLISLLDVMKEGSKVSTVDNASIIKFSKHPTFSTDIVMLVNRDIPIMPSEEVLKELYRFGLDHYSAESNTTYFHAPLWVAHVNAPDVVKPIVELKLTKLGLVIVTM